jgi:amino acid transporter
MSSISPNDELNEFGYSQKFLRTIRSFDSFAVAFSFISITTGIFATFGYLLNTGGPRGLWTWPIVIVGQYLVAMVYGALASRIPLAGYSYQWGTRLSGWRTGWWLGWISMCFLFIVVVSVDYAFVQVAFQPLIGQAYTPMSAAIETAITIAIQGIIIFASTKTTARLNSAAVITEVAGIVVLVLALVIGAIVKHHGSVSNVLSTGIVPTDGYWKWIGPFMLSTLLGAYTIVGFEAASNLAEETDNARKVIPASMTRAVALSGVMGLILLLGASFAISDMEATAKSSAPIAFLVEQNLGTIAAKILLFVVCISIFACGMINLMTNTRLIYAMARDGRLPGHKSLSQAPKPTGGPSWATAVASLVSIAIVLGLSNSTNALTTLFSASTIMPALAYLGTVLLFIKVRKNLKPSDHGIQKKSWEMPIAILAVVWLLFELSCLIFPPQFRNAQYYVLGTLALGVVFFAYATMQKNSQSK